MYMIISGLVPPDLHPVSHNKELWRTDCFGHTHPLTSFMLYPDSQLGLRCTWTPDEC